VAAANKRPQLRHEWTIAILMYLFATTTLVQAYVIPTGSMEGNLRVGDHILFDRVSFAQPGFLGRHVLPYRDIERGDIVAFLYPKTPHDLRQTSDRLAGRPHPPRQRTGDPQWPPIDEPYTQHTATFYDAYRDSFPLSPETYTTPRGRRCSNTTSATAR